VAQLELRDITVERGGRPVVKDVTITVPAGEVTALLGPNGAGKSSLVLAVGGVLRPRPGSVLLDGTELAGRRPEKIRAAGVAIVPEGRRLLPDLSVDDNIKVATYALSKQAAAEGRARALELFPRLGERLTVAARLLSGGEQQMVVLAQALVSQPKYMLIDELSLGLAPVVVNQLIPVIHSVAASGVGVLLIEQFATVALSLATGAHVMEGGVLRYSGTAAELKARPELLQSAYLLRGSTIEAATVIDAGVIEDLDEAGASPELPPGVTVAGAPVIAAAAPATFPARSGDREAVALADQPGDHDLEGGHGLRAVAAAVVLQDDRARARRPHDGPDDLADPGPRPVTRVDGPVQWHKPFARAVGERFPRPDAVGRAEHARVNPGRRVDRVRRPRDLRPLPRCAQRRQPGVVPRVIDDRMAGVGDLPRDRRVADDAFPDHREGGPDTVLLQDPQHLWRVDGARPVIDGQRDGLGPVVQVVDRLPGRGVAGQDRLPGGSWVRGRVARLVPRLPGGWRPDKPAGPGRASRGARCRGLPGPAGCRGRLAPAVAPGQRRDPGHQAARRDHQHPPPHHVRAAPAWRRPVINRHFRPSPRIRDIPFAD
jgi:branched-chain amino acid transport system ATP-binding protein